MYPNSPISCKNQMRFFYKLRLIKNTFFNSTAAWDNHKCPRTLTKTPCCS